jgi:hypothetical protein
MKFVNIETSHSKEELIALIRDNEKVNPNMRADERRGKPVMKINEKGNRIKIKCEMIGGASKDNGFLVGTYFSGKISEKKGKTRLKGVILTAPIYHLCLIALLCLFALQCIKMKGFSPVPIILLLFDLLLFEEEFKKQTYIYSYLNRAARILNK